MNDITRMLLILNMLTLISFLSWPVIGIILGIKLLGNYPVLIPAWLLIVPFIIPVLALSFQTMVSQFLYGFDFIYTIVLLAGLVIYFFLFRWSLSGYSILDVVEEDLLDCLKTVADKHNIAYSKLNSRFMLGNKKNFVKFAASGLSSANIHIDNKSFPASKEFISDLHLELGKRTLDGPPNMGRIVLLGSLILVAVWIFLFFN